MRPSPSPAKVCPVCAGPLALHMSAVSDPITGFQFDILKCAVCGLGVTDPSPEQLQPYYARYYGSRHAFTTAYCAKRRIALVSKVTREGSGRRLLDVGCGDGMFLKVARTHGWQVTGTELNAGPARRAGFEVYQTLDECASLAPFDCVTFWHSLEHMRDPRAVISKVRNLVADDGFLFIAVPDFGGLQSKTFKSRWLHLDVPRHLYHFTASSIDKMLQQSEFTPLAQWHQEIEYDLMGWSQSALNVMLPTQNVFFDLLTRKKVSAAALQKAVSWISGPLLSFASLPLVWLGSFARSGGTLLVAAQRVGPSAQRRQAATN